MDGKKKSATFYTVLIALFAALIFVLTRYVQIPYWNGYINFGDALIFLASSMLGPFGGALSGAIGSSLADLFSPYAEYAPFTFVIKGAEGFLAGILYMYVFRRMRPALRRLLSMLIAGAWMVLGYVIADTILTYDFVAALLNNLVSGSIQASVSIVMAMIIMPHIPTLFDSVKAHTENDDDDLYEKELAERDRKRNHASDEGTAAATADKDNAAENATRSARDNAAEDTTENTRENTAAENTTANEQDADKGGTQ